MKPKKIDGKWYIEAYAEGLGNVLLCTKNIPLPIPVAFDNEEYAWEYIRGLEEEESERG